MKGKKKYDNTSRLMRKAGIEGGVTPILRKGEWEKERQVKKTQVPSQGMPIKKFKQKHRDGIVKIRKVKMKKNPLALSTKVILEMAKDKAGGATTAQLAAKYHVSSTYINDSLQHLFLNNRIGREILRGVLLENAVACGMHARSKVDDLNAMQAVVATGIMSSRYVELDKHSQNQAADDVDFSELAKISDNLKQLNDYVGPINQYESGSVIDVEVTKDNESE